MGATEGGRASRPRDSVWLTGGPTRRGAGDQPAGLDLERIVAATIRLLDAEGAQRFSMRRLAAELGVTAMSVYWYVDGKDQLLELAVDAVAGEIALPDETDTAADWRDQLRHLADEYRRVLVAHSWAPRLLGEYLNIGPRAIAFANATMRVVRRCGLPPEQVSGALAAVFQFVYGFATIEGVHEARCREAGVGLDEHYRTVMDSLRRRPEFDETLALSETALGYCEGMTLREKTERDWHVSLDLQIAGIEALRDRAARTATAASRS